MRLPLSLLATALIVNAAQVHHLAWVRTFRLPRFIFPARPRNSPAALRAGRVSQLFLHQLRIVRLPENRQTSSDDDRSKLQLARLLISVFWSSQISVGAIQARKFPVIRLEFPVLPRNFPDSLLREFAEKSLWHSGFLL
jgi:hypothetical protein